MAVATEKIIPGVLPPKEETEGVDFLSIFDAFDAATLSDEQLGKFAPRNPYVTAYGSEERYYKVGNKTYPVPDSPIKERLHHGKFCVGSYRQLISVSIPVAFGEQSTVSNLIYLHNPVHDETAGVLDVGVMICVVHGHVFSGRRNHIYIFSRGASSGRGGGIDRPQREGNLV